MKIADHVCGYMIGSTIRRLFQEASIMSEVTLPTTYGFKNLKGMKFGRLTVVEYAGKQRYSRAAWHCQCDCGNITEVSTRRITTGHTKSCGCHRKETSRRILTTHGDTGTAEHSTWNAMIKRCENRNTKEYQNYGGRGIRVCARWRESYAAFLEDMGRKPTPTHSIDRIDNNGDYTSDNCRWATRTEQSRNRRSNRMITYKGETRCLIEWSELLGFNFIAVNNRLQHNWTFERAITTPVRKRGVK